MPKPRILLDTNILVSGLVFRRGNEHKIVRMVEEGGVTLVLPDPVVDEARGVFAEKFGGLEGLLEMFLDKARPEAEAVPMDRLLSAVGRFEGEVRDKKDTAIYAAVQVAVPDYAVTGDRVLREDLLRSKAARGTKIVASKEFLKRLKG